MASTTATVCRNCDKSHRTRRPDAGFNYGERYPRSVMRRIMVVPGYVAMFIFCINLDSSLAFNIDTKVPIVKTGVSDSYFGFSIAQHYVFNHAKSFSDPLVLVGAPRDNITDPTASQRVRNIVRPGMVYKCPFTSQTNDCTALRIDQEDPQGDADKNNQWMGVSVISQATDHGKAAACAHRYKKSGAAFTWGLGICISMTNELDEEDPWEPCDGKPKDRGHGEYGFCQAGTSAAFNKDGDLIIGSPGAYNWRGAVFKNNLQQSVHDEKQWFQNVVEDPIPPATSPTPTTAYYAYLGMSVKIGNILGGKKTFVAGAPRSKDCGEVLMFQMGQNGLLKIDKRHYLTGVQFGAGFGYDLAVADFNTDGKDDLAVGAPFFRGKGIGGAVYIFMNGPQGITKDTVPINITIQMKEPDCLALDCHNSRFGFSLASIGDIDRDGYQDLAVGAPYEGNGAVYIFRGSAEGLSRVPSQRIHASDLLSARTLRTFGYSLSGGIDMDNNGYPDLTVGAFQSDKLLMLRTRPVINVVSTFKANPTKIDPKITECTIEGKERTKNNCFELSLCFRFTAEPKERFGGPIDIDYKIDAEKFYGAKVSRISFKGAVVPAEGHTIDRTVVLREQGQEQCRSHIVYLIKNNRDFLTPIQLQLVYKLKDVPPPTMSPGQAIPDINSYPVLNNATSVIPLAVNFVKNCRRDTECISNLEVKATLESATHPLQKDDASDDYTLRKGVDKEVRLSIVVTNQDQEEAHETVLNVTLPESLKFFGIEGKKYSCVGVDNYVICSIGNPLPKDEEVSFKIKLNPENAQPEKHLLNITVRVNTTSKESNLLDDVKVLRINVTILTDLEVEGKSSPTSVYYSGVIRGESDIKREDQIGTEVIHTYVVTNKGGAAVAHSMLEINWPYEKEIGHDLGKHVLYLLDNPEVEGPGYCVLNDTIINPRRIALLTPPQTREPEPPSIASIDRSVNNVTKGGSSGNRRRRNDLEEHEMIDDGKSSSVAKLRCGDKSTRCSLISCYFKELLPLESITIKLRARLWNSTFLEDYTKVDMVQIFSKASIKIIDPNHFIRQTNTTNDVFEVMTKAIPGLQVVGPKPIPLWVIIVAICAGLFLLFIIIFLLWHCGFFKRRKPDEMAIHKAKLENQKNYTDYD